MNVARELKAKSSLAIALMKNILVRPFRGSSAGLWLGRLAEDDLTPTASETWQRVEGTSRCIGCGLCDVVDGSFSATVVGAARRPQDAPVVAAAGVALGAQAEAIARICPAGVSVSDIAWLIAENAAALSRADVPGPRRSER